MKTPLRAMIIVLLLASCGGSSTTPPRDLDNACAILKQRPDYHKAFKATERKWGIPIHVQMATIHQESKFVAMRARPSAMCWASSQWAANPVRLAMARRWMPRGMNTASRSARHAKRDKIKDATDFMGWYMNTSRDRNGIALHDARNQYLAYHEGHTGFRKASYNSKPWLVAVAGKVEDAVRDVPRTNPRLPFAVTVKRIVAKLFGYVICI